MKTTGIVDIPLKSEESDKLQMKSFEMALSEFIQHTSTPITIALQGEWGSGKTSLMNRLDKQLCLNEDSNFYSIWLNTWQYSLMKNDENILIGIINALINQVVDISKKEHPEKLKHLIKDVYKVGKSVFKGLSKVAVKTTISHLSEEAADVINDNIFNEKEITYSLNDLKNNLSKLINENIEKNIENGVKKEAFIFFIDDLDRIDPTLAVNILELMKNIFDIDNCIFILAIDYDVVVKGLKEKFGELDEQNEREFRSFFDKIIQLPFQMPVSSYVINDYVKDFLLSVNIITNKEAENEDFIKSIVLFTSLSVGTNPRSIKRLVNTLSFINLLIKSKNTLNNTNKELLSYEKQLIFALISLQTGFPSIYNLLADNADIENWSDKFAQKYELDITKYKTDEDTLLTIKWEQILFEFCKKSTYLNRRFFNIINIIKQMQVIADSNNKNLNELLPKTVELLSVTSINAISKPIIEINNIRVLYALNQKIAPILQKKLCEPLKFVERKGRMIAKLTYKFDEQKSNNWISISVSVKHNSIFLKIGNSIELFSSKKNSEESFMNFERFGTTELFSEFIQQLENLNKKTNILNFAHKPRTGLFVKKQKQMFEQYFQTSTQNIEYFYSNKFIEKLSDFIIDFMLLSYKMTNADWKVK